MPESSPTDEDPRQQSYEQRRAQRKFQRWMDGKGREESFHKARHYEHRYRAEFNLYGLRSCDAQRFLPTEVSRKQQARAEPQASSTGDKYRGDFEASVSDDETPKRQRHSVSSTRRTDDPHQ